ncbi:MAG: hypothetical protein JXA21_06440 [Anaerolineae bacterium]|nr:hypothetical protein [Anaerolineae bacterium]
MKEYGVCYTLFNKAGRLVTKERFFASAESRERFIVRLMDSGDLYEIVAWLDPQ